jgi:hypothetical protein
MDIMGYAVQAHMMLEGRPLYSELWNHKPPAIQVTFALGELVGGYGKRSIYLLGVTAAVLTTIGVYFAGAAPPWGRAAGLWSAAFWAISSGSLHVEANQPNTEVFINTCLAAAFALLVGVNGRALGWRRVVFIGLLFALASLYKQIAVAVAMTLGLAHIAFPPDGAAGRRRALVEVSVMAGTGAVVWCLVFAYFWAVGRFAPFYEAVFVFNRHYSDSPWSNINEVPHVVFGNVRKVPLLLLVGAACLVAIWPLLRRLDRSCWLLMAYALGVHLAIQLPGKRHPHYYQLWLPVVAIGAAWGACALTTALTRSGMLRGRAGLLQHLVCLVALVQLAMVEGANYRLPAQEWSRLKFGVKFLEAERLAPEIDSLLLPGETFYDAFDNIGLYFMTRRDPPTGVIHYLPLVEGPLVEPLSKRVIADLEARPPELIVSIGEVPVDYIATLPAYGWWLARYRLFPGNPKRGSLLLYVRRGGALERRLERAAAGRSSRS